jgi:hypothetical protein
MKAAVQSVGETVTATAKTASSMFSDLADFQGTMSEKWFLQDILKDQVAIERESVQSAAKVAEAQANYFNARAKAMERGDALIKVTGDTLAPHLRGMMLALFDEIHIEVTEAGLESMLIGGQL